MPNIRQHYAHLKQAGVSGQEIKQQSTFHLRRQLLSTLRPEKRAAFRVVERYQLVARKIGVQWSAQDHPAQEPIKRSQLKYLDHLSQARDQLAYQMLSNRDGYDKALDFYQIGMAVSYFGDNRAADTSS